MTATPKTEPQQGPKPPFPLREVLGIPCRTPADKVLLLTMAEKCDWASRRIAKSLDELAALSGLGRRTVQAAVIRLGNSGRIRPEKRRKNGVWIYELVLPVAAPKADPRPETPKVPGRDGWRVEEILRWARGELGLRPASSDFATAEEWVEMGISRAKNTQQATMKPSNSKLPRPSITSRGLNTLHFEGFEGLVRNPGQMDRPARAPLSPKGEGRAPGDGPRGARVRPRHCSLS